MSIKKLRHSLEQAFGDVSVDIHDDGRFVVEVAGFIKVGGNERAPLVALGDTEYKAVKKLTQMVQDHAVKEYLHKYPRQIACPSRVFRDDGRCVLYRDNKLTVK